MGSYTTEATFLTYPETCIHGGLVVNAVEVTVLGEAFHRYYIQCDCPTPVCPCCRRQLVDGRCVTDFCAIDGCVVPIPDWNPAERSSALVAYDFL